MRIISTLVFLFFSTLAYSQEIYQILAEETCNCIEDIDIEEMSMAQREMNLGICMFKAANKHKVAFAAAHSGKDFLELANEDEGEKVGEDIAIEMLELCPMIFMGFLADESDGSEEYALSVELGKISSVEKNQFNIVNLKMGDGSTLKFLWLWDFEGSELMIDNAYKDKWINIFFQEIPLYNSQQGKYINYKVIEGMELGE